VIAGQKRKSPWARIMPYGYQRETTGLDAIKLATKADAMQTKYEFHTTQFIHSVYEGSLLFTYVLGLVGTVVLGAYGLETLFRTLL